MSTITQSSITLSAVNDALSVLMSPSTCVITANADGTNPNLTNAYTNINLVRGDFSLPFNLSLVSKSDEDIQFSIVDVNESEKKLLITSIPTDILEGSLIFDITSSYYDYTSSITFQFSVMRDKTLLDWVLDWDSNKTSIGGDYLITPKIFVGRRDADKDDFSALTGVYIGPDYGDSAGLYGLKNGIDIFHINDREGFIAGWIIDKESIHTKDNRMRILSRGEIGAYEQDNAIWSILSDGTASFAKGNVIFKADGSADFTGKITSESGKIANWLIKESQLHSDFVMLDSYRHYIGVGKTNMSAENIDKNYDHKSKVKKDGGVFMFYENENSYGLEGYLPSPSSDKAVFKLGALNMLAGWYFDADAIWIGEKQNTQRSFTDNINSITIGTWGLRGKNWRMDNDGSGAIGANNIIWDEKGNITLSENVTLAWGGTIGKTLTHIDSTGIYTGTLTAEQITAGFIDVGRIEAGSILADKIDANSLKTQIINTDYINGLSCSFVQGSIGGWDINQTGIQTGDGKMQILSSGSITAKESAKVTIFSLSKDGNAYFAKGNVLFNADGTGKIGKWDISATAITNGNVSLGADGTVSNGDFWKLANDGSGYLACKNLTWDNLGNASFLGTITATAGKIGEWLIDAATIKKGNVTLGADGSIANEGKWKLANDGSGYLANKNILWAADGSGSLGNGNIAWDADGNITFSAKVSINWTDEINTVRTEFGDKISLVNQTITNTQAKVSTLEATSSSLSASVVSLNSSVGSAADRASEAYNLANTAKSIAESAGDAEVYRQSSNPWQSWPSGTEKNHVGAFWYDTSTNTKKRYIGYDNTNSWEDVTASQNAASYISQTADKISSVVANFDSNGNPTTASGLVTTAYGSTLWAKKNELITEINVCPEAAVIKSNRIALEGLVTVGEKVKITTDGRIIAVDGEFTGKITATSGIFNDVTIKSGIIAGLKISGNSLTNEGFNNDASIVLRNDSNGTFAAMGGNVNPPSSAQVCIARFENSHTTGLTNYGVIISVTNATTNIALHINHGMVSGLKTYTRQISSTTYLNDLDHTISCYNTSNITVYLPSNPEIGRQIFIARMNSYSVYVNGNGKQIHEGPNYVSQIVMAHNGEVDYFHFDGQYWLYGWFNYG